MLFEYHKVRDLWGGLKMESKKFEMRLDFRSFKPKYVVNDAIALHKGVYGTVCDVINWDEFIPNYKKKIIDYAGLNRRMYKIEFESSVCNLYDIICNVRKNYPRGIGVIINNICIRECPIKYSSGKFEYIVKNQKGLYPYFNKGDEYPLENKWAKITEIEIIKPTIWERFKRLFLDRCSYKVTVCSYNEFTTKDVNELWGKIKIYGETLYMWSVMELKESDNIEHNNKKGE